MKVLAAVLLLGMTATTTRADWFWDVVYPSPPFHSEDPLAQYDEQGRLHQSKELNSTDFAPRYRARWMYYFQHPDILVTKPAYVGALQVALQRNGYYCGPVDGVFSGEVSDAICKLQKNHSMRVTGTLTDPVRRALYLP